MTTSTDTHSSNTNVNISSMTNISKSQGMAFASARAQLQKILIRLTKSSSDDFLNGLLTESERIMLIKRFGAIFLLHHKHSPYQTAALLGLSEPTVHRLKESYQAGEFDTLLKLISKKEENVFLSVLTDFALSRASYKARQRLHKKII
jgi:hypothetical protein